MSIGETPEVPGEEEVIETPETETPSEASGAQDAEAGDSGNTGSEEIEIDGQKFKSEREALDWAIKNKDKLERDKLVAEAYSSGLQESAYRGMSHTPTPAAPPEEDNFEEKFYANPKQALAERDAKLAKKIKDELNADMSAKDLDRQIWDEFSSAHPDLADFRTDVEQIAASPEHVAIVKALAQTKGSTAAYDYVAQKTRAKFQSYIERSKSVSVLPRGTAAGPTPTGAPKSVTPPKKVQKPLSMRDQLRQHKARFQQNGMG